jgi:hypothetical protein
MDDLLRAELLRRAERDQAARRAIGDDWERVQAVDAGNLAWFRNVVTSADGWPGRSRVGADGAHAAWLLAQHADRDPVFQRACLELMTEAVAMGEASRAELAYLTDRVLLAEGQPQEYGTQMAGRRDGWRPRRLRDPERVDVRRAQMSLGTLADYIAEMARAYGPASPMRVQCGACGGGIDVWPADEGEQTACTCPACGWTATFATGLQPWT